MVPTVDRGLRLVDFWSIDTAGDRPSMKSTSGLSICPRNCRAYADNDSTYRRCPSAKIVSNARLDLPDPESPVKTMRLSRGRSTDTSRRLCSRAPRTTREWALPVGVAVTRIMLGGVTDSPLIGSTRVDKPRAAGHLSTPLPQRLPRLPRSARRDGILDPMSQHVPTPIGGLAVPAALRLPGLLRGAARHSRPRALAHHPGRPRCGDDPQLRRQLVRPGDDPRDGHRTDPRDGPHAPR